MNGKPCASPGIATCWEAIDWQKALAYVKKLQVRIVKAQKEGHYSKVKSLQWLLTHSFYAKALAVKRVTSNQGKRTSGVDHELWLTPQAKFNAISKLNRRGYHPQEKRKNATTEHPDHDRQSHADTLQIFAGADSGNLCRP